MTERSIWRAAVYYALLFVMVIVLVPRAGFGGDVDFWINWATYDLEHGLGNAYQNPGNNYNPFYHWVLWGYGHLMKTPERISFYAHFLKAFTLLFDFAGAIWAASLVKERYRRFELSLLLLLNIGFLYNTLVWEQVDAIYSFWSFGAVVLAARRRPVLSGVFYALALLAKTQAIIFLPPLLLLWWPLWLQRPWQLLQSLAAMGLTFLVGLAPFIWWGWQNDLPRIIDINVFAASSSPVISMNAYNLWALFHPRTGGYDLMKIADDLTFAGLTYKHWGLLLFMTFSGLALLPLLWLGIQQLLARVRGTVATAPALPLVLLACGLIPVMFAFFNTEMHERYWHACLLLLSAYGFVSRRYLLFGLVSVAYFLNLEGVMHFIWLKNYDILIFKPAFVASLFGLAIIVGLVQLYALWLRKQPLTDAAEPRQPAAWPTALATA